MNDFEGLLASDYGLKPQGKPAPMAASKGSSATSGGNDFDFGSRGTSRSMGNTNDGDSIFGSLGNQKNQDKGGFGDLFGGSAFARHTSKSESRTADSPFNLDSMYRASSDNGSKYTSAPPVFDKPIYDDDIFEGVPGLKSSAKANYDDVFASVASESEPGRAAAATAGGNDAFDDLLGGFSKVNRESKSFDGKTMHKDDNGVAGFEDLLPSFGGSREPSGRPTSDPVMTTQASFSSSRKMSDEPDDPFKIFESASIPQESLSSQFIDPLEEISRFGSSRSTKLDSASVSNAKYADVDPFYGLGESVPVFSSEWTKRKDRSPSRTYTGTTWDPTVKDSSEKSSIRSPERKPQNIACGDGDPDFSQASFSKPSHSSDDNTSEESNVNDDMSPKDEGKLESDDVWLAVSHIPLFTQPTAAPPPSRPPPSRPVQAVNSEFGSVSHTNTRRKGNNSSFLASTQYYQAPKSAPGTASIPTTSHVDELNDFGMGMSYDDVDEFANGVSGEELEMNTVAAAMKEAMDRAEAKLQHAKGVREREGTKATRRETVQLEREEKTSQEEREKQERSQLQKEREENERLEKEREEKKREQGRLERERERARELERERARGRQAVERATREARERAAVEARARAERAAVEKANAEARQHAERAAVQRAQAEARKRAAADAKDRAEKAASEVREKVNAEARTDNEARLRTERAAVERAAAEAQARAAAEARERASAAAKMNQQKNDNDLEAFFSMGSRPSSAPRPRTNTSDSVFDNPFQNSQEPSVAKRSAEVSSSMRKTSSANFVDDLSSIFGASSSSGEFQEIEGETEERRRARLERHQRTQERAVKALAEKNERDIQNQKEQAERHRISETLDVEIKRWAAGKEGNLRALLSTLHYVLWPECGWQPVSLTDLITGASVKKVYRKATLCIHPDKVQQKGANLQQKYIAEKVFDLLKEAWNKLNSEELF